MKRKLMAITLFVMCLASVTAWSATTGRITGTVTDTQTKQPLIGASVALVGTTLGGITDENGRYTIANVPVGTYKLRISSVGYGTVEVDNTSVSADLVTYEDRTLSSSATDIGKTIQVTAEAPLIIKDKTSSISIVKRDQIQAMPVRGVNQIVGIQNSVVKVRPFGGTVIRGDREATNGSEITLRGGRPAEVAYFVDGYSTQDPLSGTNTASLSNNAIKEVTVYAGGFSPEYGNVSSGVVNTITNSGGDLYKGSLEVLSDNIGSDNFDQNWYNADLGGPIPGTEKAFFFVSGERRYWGDRAPSSITNDFLPGGSYRLPNNNLEGFSLQGKVNYKLTPSFELAVSGTGSRDEWREYVHSYLFNAAHMPYYDDRHLGLNTRVTHTLSATTFYNLSASYSTTQRFRGDGVLRKDLAAYTVPGGNPRFEDASLFWLGDDPSTSGDDGHVYDDYLKRKSAYVGLRGDIRSDINEEHSLLLGFELQRHTLRYYDHLFPAQGNSDGTRNTTDIDRFGYDVNGNETDGGGKLGLDGPKHPINVAAYAHDRFEWRGLILSAGLRFDYFDYKAKRIKNLERPFDPDNTPDPLSAVLDAGDLEESEKFTRLSPRLGIAFPVSDRTQLHLNFGKFFQRPNLVQLYVGYDYYEYKVTSGGYYYPIGNPNLRPERTTAYEIGMSQSFGDNTTLDINAFYKDILDQIQVYNQAASPRNYSSFKNSDYGTVKGLEFNLTQRAQNNIAFGVKYTLQYANGTGSFANTARNSAWTNDNAPKQPASLEYDQRHSLIGNIDWRMGEQEGPAFAGGHPFENFSFNVLLYAGSGLPYSPQGVYNEVTLASVTPTPTDVRNSVYMPWTSTIDFKAKKSFALGRYTIAPYIQVNNLLNRDNVIAVYESTGRPNTTGWLSTEEGEAFSETFAEADASGLNGEQKYNLKENNPLNYGPPRQIFFGLQLSF